MKILANRSPTFWVTSNKIFSQAFALLLFAIQAPILGPRAFGVISIVMLFVGFCEYVPCEAAAESLISIREIDDEHFATMTTANVLLALLIGVVVFGGAPRIAGWFGDAELIGILRWMSVLPAISAFAAAPTAATKREMHFQPLALRAMGSVFVGGIVGLALTLSGAGVWSLVWQAIVTRVVAVMVLWSTVPLKFRIGLSWRHLRDLLQFAAPTMASKTLTWSSSQIPRLVLGLYWGPTTLGLFGMASRLGDILAEVAVLPHNIVARVDLRRYHLDPASLEVAVRRVLRLMTISSAPLCIGGAALIPTLFHVWLDPRWQGAIVPTQCMLLAPIALVTQYLTGATLTAMNFQGTEALLSIGHTVLTIIVALVCAPFGLIVASAGIAARPYLLLPLAIELLKRKCKISPRALLDAQFRPLVAALIMGACVWALRIFLATVVKDAAALPILAAVGAALYITMMSRMTPKICSVHE